MNQRQHLYTDGGVAGKNPSLVGGAWAYRLVVGDTLLTACSGGVTPDDLRVEAVTNNHTETLAAVIALSDMPAGWEGTLWTDSEVVYHRLTGRAACKGLPGWLIEELQSVKKDRERGGRNWTVNVLAGHPTRKDLIAGFKLSKGSKKVPVSSHNVECDRACREMCLRLLGGVSRS